MKPAAGKNRPRPRSAPPRRRIDSPSSQGTDGTLRARGRAWGAGGRDKKLWRRPARRRADQEAGIGGIDQAAHSRCGSTTQTLVPCAISARASPCHCARARSALTDFLMPSALRVCGLAPPSTEKWWVAHQDGSRHRDTLRRSCLRPTAREHPRPRHRPAWLASQRGWLARLLAVEFRQHFDLRLSIQQIAMRAPISFIWSVLRWLAKAASSV